jgi:phosphopantothenate-cysteine ligase
MAVSDFTFKENKIKLKSDSTEDFVQYIADNIEKAPKIISHFREWNPIAKLVGFKFEVGLETDQLLNIARRSLILSDLDYVVANDKVEMEKTGEHIAYIISKSVAYNYHQCIGKEDIANSLYRFLSL